MQLQLIIVNCNMILVAKCKYNGCIVGASINASTNPWDPDMEEKLACKIQSDEIRKLILFYAHIMRVPDLWRCLGVQKVYEVLVFSQYISKT